MPDQVRHLYIMQNSLEYKKQTKFFKSAPYALLRLHHSAAYVIKFIKSNSYYILIYIFSYLAIQSLLAQAPYSRRYSCKSHAPNSN